MQKAIREVEKKYLKLDEPVLKNVNLPSIKISDLITGKKAIDQAELKDVEKYLTEQERK